MAIVALLALSLGTVFVLYLYSAGAHAEIVQKAPDYARRLYRSGSEQFMRSAYPVREIVLFLEPVPSNLTGTIWAMRVIYATHLALASLFIAIAAAYLFF